jgi:Tfp pilus assembly protein PilX
MNPHFFCLTFHLSAGMYTYSLAFQRWGICVFSFEKKCYTVVETVICKSNPMQRLSFSKLLPKGSVLVFSLIILSIMLVTALTLLSSSVLQQKASLSTANSARSFQVADAGAEQVLYQLYKQNAGSIEDVADNMGLSCSDGVVQNTSAGWTIRFYDEEDNRFTDCDTGSDQIAAIKSEGSSQSTVRAVEVAVAQSGNVGPLTISCFDHRFSTDRGLGICCATNTITGESYCRQVVRGGGWLDVDPDFSGILN